MEEADQLCSRVAIMDHGKILALDTPAQLKATVGADTIVVVSAEGDLDTLSAALTREVGGAVGGTVVDGTLRLQVQGTTGVLPDVVAAAERNGYRVTDLSLTEPTLETVFINLTGKDLRD
jgi:ABC-2 type transport system ATP-binding protein